MEEQDFQNLPEWQEAHVALVAESMSVSIEARSFTLPPNYSMVQVFGELNSDTLPLLSKSIRKSLLALATVVARNSRNEWTFAITRMSNADVEFSGLKFDDKRLKILALAIKPGSQLFTYGLFKAYNPDSEIPKNYLHHMSGAAWPPHAPHNFFVITIPSEDRAIADEVARNSSMLLSEIPFAESAMVQPGVVHRIEYPFHGEDNLLYLVNELGSVVYRDPSSAADLQKIEKMLLPDSDSNSG